jgi:hypothetical protein
MAGNSLVPYTPDQLETIQLMGLPANHAHTRLLFQLADHYDLDVKRKEITLIPGKGAFIGVWGHLHVAHRSGLLDGLEMDDEWETDSHFCVRCVVWRRDMSRPAAKVIGRVGKHEKKEWPLEIARARAVRAALGYAFSIHDDYGDGADDWTPPPDERIDASVAAAPTRMVDRATGEVVEGSVPEPAPAPPDQAEPATIVVGGHTTAQKLAMAARDAGIDDDDTRHDVIWAATGGKYERGLDIPDDDQGAIDRAFDAFGGLADGSVELRYETDGTPRLWRLRRPGR